MLLGDKNLAEFLFQFIVMTQPFLWMYLNETDIEFPDRVHILVYALLNCALMAVLGNRITIGFYTVPILSQYIFLIAGSFYLYNQRKPVKEALCLAFLTVFLNSYYWELPLHLVEFMTVGFYLGQIVQLWRLVPAWYISHKYTFTKPQKRWILAGVFFSWCMMILRSNIFIVWQRAGLMFINRSACMILLTWVIIESEPQTKPEQDPQENDETA